MIRVLDLLIKPIRFAAVYNPDVQAAHHGPWQLAAVEWGFCFYQPRQRHKSGNKHGLPYQTWRQDATSLSLDGPGR